MDKDKIKTMDILNNIWKVINSRIFPYIVVIILAVLYLRGCGNLERERIESDRRLGNYLALQDTIRIISKKNEGILVEKSALEKTKKELKKENSELYTELQFEKNKPPKVIIRTVISYRDTTIIIKSSDNFNTEDSTGTLEFDYSPEFPGNNSFSLTGEVGYKLNLIDTLKPIKFGDYKLDIAQTIDIRTGLYRDPEDKRTYIRLFTDYPNLTIDDIQAIDVTDAESRKALRAARKEFGIGFSVGYGFGSNGSAGPYIGVGLNYTPRFLQFGK